MFLNNPLEWYNKFWLQTHHRMEYLVAKPNEGHLSIARISKLCNTKVITQNIDQLHAKTSLVQSHIIEVHGRLGMYKCVNPRKKNPCIYSKSNTITDIDITKYSTDFNINNKTFTIKKVPTCPCCARPVLPQTLLFDEKYESHDFYQWHRALQWIGDSDIIVFVGTSFSVGVTHECMTIARDNQKIMYNFNVRIDDEVKDMPRMHHITGKCEQTLPLLYNTLVELGKSQHLHHDQRMFFYRGSRRASRVPDHLRSGYYKHSMDSESSDEEIANIIKRQHESSSEEDDDSESDYGSDMSDE